MSSPLPHRRPAVGNELDNDEDLTRDVRFFRQRVPDRLPLGDAQAELLAEIRHLAGKRLADLVVVAQLQTEAAIELVLRRSRPTEDVHGPDVPAVERCLRLVVRGRISGELLDPELAVADVELLLL